MLCNDWDADLAVTYGPLEAELQGQPTIDRYGITVREEMVGEPLAVALAQEEPEPVVDNAADDQWLMTDQDWLYDDRSFARAADERSPEEAAMHLERL